jgi:hypothetical protein
MGDGMDFWSDELFAESGWRGAGRVTQDTDSGEDLLATWKEASR